MKFTAEFSTSDFYGNQICKADTNVRKRIYFNRMR